MNCFETRANEVYKWKLQEMDIERKINAQKLKLTSDLFELKKKEFTEDRKCKCKGFCRIYHFKHNFRKSLCNEISLKFKVLQQSEYSVVNPCCTSGGRLL